jgi:hypothetical protein
MANSAREFESDRNRRGRLDNPLVTLMPGKRAVADWLIFAALPMRLAWWSAGEGAISLMGEARMRTASAR